MEQGKYYKLSHLVPDGHPKMHPRNPPEVKEMMPYLVERSSSGWTTIPQHENLELFAIKKMEVPILGFRKNKKEVYLHVFCNEFVIPAVAMQIVLSLYHKYKLGESKFVREEPNWIHTIPLPGPGLSQSDTLLIHEITLSLFWTIYVDFQRNKCI